MKWRNISWWQLDSRGKRQLLKRSVLVVIVIVLLVGATAWWLDISMPQAVFWLVLLILGLAALAGFMPYLLAVILEAYHPPRKGTAETLGDLTGETAEVRAEDMVYVNGALWKAECDEPLTVGDKVTVTDVCGLTLKVKKLG